MLPKSLEHAFIWEMQIFSDTFISMRATYTPVTVHLVWLPDLLHKFSRMDTKAESNQKGVIRIPKSLDSTYKLLNFGTSSVCIYLFNPVCETWSKERKSIATNRTTTAILRWKRNAFLRLKSQILFCVSLEKGKILLGRLSTVQAEYIKWSSQINIRVSKLAAISFATYDFNCIKALVILWSTVFL